MFVHYRTRGIVVKKDDRGEFDQLLTVYCQKFGKLEILGKAVKKIDSKLRAGTDIFYLSDIEFIQGKSRKILTDAVLVKKFQNLRNSLLKLKIAYKISDVLDSLIKGQEADEKNWQLLVETLERLDKEESAGRQTEIIYYYFFWKFVSFLGYRPELYCCPICQNKLRPGQLGFDFRENGVICQSCFKESKLIRQISPEAVKVLRVIVGSHFKDLIKLKIDGQYLKELKLISEKYYLALCENLS